MPNCTRNERRRCQTTLETSGEDAKLHSKRVEKTLYLSAQTIDATPDAGVKADMQYFDRFFEKLSSPLVSSVIIDLLHSFRVYFGRYYQKEHWGNEDIQVSRGSASSPPVSSVALHLLHPFRVWLCIFSTRLECGSAHPFRV